MSGKKKVDIAEPPQQRTKCDYQTCFYPFLLSMQHVFCIVQEDKYAREEKDGQADPSKVLLVKTLDGKQINRDVAISKQPNLVLIKL